MLRRGRCCCELANRKPWMKHTCVQIGGAAGIDLQRCAPQVQSMLSRGQLQDELENIEEHYQAGGDDRFTS